MPRCKQAGLKAGCVRWAGCVSGSLIPVPLLAATIEQTFTGTLQTGDNVPQNQDQVSINFSQFNPGLGTLTGVQFELTSALQSGVTFYYPGFDSVTFSYTPRNYVETEFADFPDPPTGVVDYVLPTQNHTNSGGGSGSLW